MIKIGTLTVFLVCVQMLVAQSIRTFEPLLQKYPPGSKANTSKLQKITEPPSLTYDMMYLIQNADSKTLYGRPVQKIALGATDDSIAAISIYVPFDTSLHREMEQDLGAPEFGWMSFAAGADTAGVLWTRYWDLPNYSVSFKCTRYQYQMGEVQEDLIAISMLPKRKKSSE